MRGGDGVAISIIAEGADDSSRFASLLEEAGEVRIIQVPAGSTSVAARLNPIVDEAPSHWILVVREGERVPDELASEISRSIGESPRAWGYRIGVRRLYCGEALVPDRRLPGDVRLFHRRKSRLQQDGRMKVQGTVVRLRGTLDLVLHDSPGSHVRALEAAGAQKVPFPGRLMRWIVATLAAGPRALFGADRRYRWVEAGWRRPR